jgi:hypothetical protein
MDPLMDVLLLSIDGGGSSCRARLCTDGIAAFAFCKISLESACNRASNYRRIAQIFPNSAPEIFEHASPMTPLRSSFARRRRTDRCAGAATRCTRGRSPVPGRQSGSLDRAMACGTHTASPRYAVGVSQGSDHIAVSAVSDARANMEAEWEESPDAVRREREALEAPLAELLRCIRRAPPSFVITCARGSPAHSATFGKHLDERYLGIPPFAPNVATIYKQRLRLNGQLFLTVL